MHGKITFIGRKQTKKSSGELSINIETKRNPFEGIGGPEPLRYNWEGYWSRRINKEHRFVYKAKKDELLIAQCRYHY